MKVRYRTQHDKDWTIGELSEIELKLKSPKDGIAVRLPCDHAETWNDDGVEYCKICGDYLRVTSYRD